MRARTDVEIDRAFGRELARHGGRRLIQRATRKMESVIVPTNAERKADWAARFIPRQAEMVRYGK